MNHNHSNTHNNMHLWMMILCCALPIVLIFAIGFFGLSLGSLSAWLPYAMILLCPLSMFFMMRGMTQDHANTESQQAQTPHAISTSPQAKTTSGVGTVSTESGHEHCH
jgi:choline-glycine betaine transporter